MRAWILVAAVLTTGWGDSAMSAERGVAIDGGKAQLHGTLIAGARGPAVMLISGSGPTDRDGDSAIAGIKPGSLRLLAEALAARGVASLRFDKRAIGESATAAPPEIDLRFTTYVEDAVAWTRFLAAQPGFTCVVIVGHSEGALIGAIAATKTPVCGLVEIAGAGRPGETVLAEQLQTAVPEPMRTQALATLRRIAAGEAVADPPMPALFRPSVQPYLMSWLKLDPAAELARYKGPVLIIQGENDLQVTVDDAHRLFAASPRATLKLIPGMNHVLKDAPVDRAANLATYKDPTLPVDPAVPEAIRAFVRTMAR